MVGNGLVKGGVKDGNVGHVGKDAHQRFNGSQVHGVVQRRQVADLADVFDDLVGDPHGRVVVGATVHHAMGHGGDLVSGSSMTPISGIAEAVEDGVDLLWVLDAAQVFRRDRCRRCRYSRIHSSVAGTDDLAFDLVALVGRVKVDKLERWCAAH